MISRIVLVCVIALVTYVLIPAAARLAIRQRWKNIIARLGRESGLNGICTGYSGGKLTVKSVPLTAGMPEEERNIALDPRKTRFFMFRKNGVPEKIAWRTVFLIKNGTTVSVLQSKKRNGRSVCVFHEEKNAASLTALAARLLSPGDTDPGIPELPAGLVKYFSVAAGAFLEFGLFLESLQHPEMGIVSISALVGIFGKALPYLPPGLLLTLAGHLVIPQHAGTKKNRQRKTAGFLLKTAGILLNIAVVFFAIRKVGFGLP